MNPETADQLARAGAAAWQGGPDLVTIIGSALGLGFLSGFRLYATVVALGLAIRFHWFTPNETMSSLMMLADSRVMGVAAGLALVEFLADKIPWVDSAWDSVHTFVRPIAATAMAATALGSMDPASRTLLALLSGGVALTTHSAKAATRFAVNHSPEPYSNWLLSIAEDLAAPLALWFISAHPGIFLGLLAVFLAFAAYVGPRLARQMRVEMAALRAILGRWIGVGPQTPATLTKAAMADSKASQLWDILYPYVDELPAKIAAKSGMNAGARAVATQSLPELSRSIGYLCFRDKKLTFLTRRWFRSVGFTVAYADLREVRFERGFFMDHLILETVRGEKLVFDLFRGAPNEATAAIKPAAAPSAASS